MSDLLGILVSGIMMLFVAFRAIQLDSTLPWFKPIKNHTQTDNAASPEVSGTGRNGRPNGTR